MNDLFGNPIADKTLPRPSQAKKRRDETPRGYAGTPGRGPAGHYCRDCRHLVRKHMAGTFLKCFLLRNIWTSGPKTDIRAKSPACENWAPKQQLDPDVMQKNGQRSFYVKH